MGSPWLGAARIMIENDDKELIHGEVTTSVSVGTANQTEGEGSPSEPEITKETLPLREVPLNHYSKVRLTYGITKSIGNYEFVRADVSAEDFCHPDQKQECWDNLDKEVSLRISKVMDNVEKFRNTKPVSTSHSSGTLDGIETVAPRDPEIEELRKLIWQQMVIQAKFGKIKLTSAIEKMKKAELTVEFCKKLLESLEKNDVSFFLGREINGSSDDETAFESDVIEASFEA
jgi:hypothetical protein